MKKIRFSKLIDQLRWENGGDEPDFLNEPGCTQGISTETFTTSIRDDLEQIHHQLPGIFWATINMDNPDLAFKKMKSIIKDIVKSQKNLKPMFDIDFVNLKYYPIVERKLASICDQVAPQRLFY